jgi:hypothetical protein
MSAPGCAQDDIEKQTAAATPSTGEEPDMPPALGAKKTIHYAEDDLENQRRSQAPQADLGHPLSRRDSIYSIHSVRSFSTRGRTIDPSLVLPATYRTVSFTISNTQERATAEAKQAKDRATEGQYRRP